MFSHNNVLITAMNTALFLCYISIYCLFPLIVGYLYLCMTNKRGFLQFPSMFFAKLEPIFVENLENEGRCLRITVFNIAYVSLMSPLFSASNLL